MAWSSSDIEKVMGIREEDQDWSFTGQMRALSHLTAEKYDAPVSPLILIQRLGESIEAQGQQVYFVPLQEWPVMHKRLTFDETEGVWALPAGGDPSVDWRLVYEVRR